MCLKLLQPDDPCILGHSSVTFGMKRVDLLQSRTTSRSLGNLDVVTAQNAQATLSGAQSSRVKSSRFDRKRKFVGVRLVALECEVVAMQTAISNYAHFLDLKDYEVAFDDVRNSQPENDGPELPCKGLDEWLEYDPVAMEAQWAAAKQQAEAEKQQAEQQNMEKELREKVQGFFEEHDKAIAADPRAILQYVQRAQSKPAVLGQELRKKFGVSLDGELDELSEQFEEFVADHCQFGPDYWVECGDLINEHVDCGYGAVDTAELLRQLKIKQSGVTLAMKRMTQADGEVNRKKKFIGVRIRVDEPELEAQQPKESIAVRTEDVLYDTIERLLASPIALGKKFWSSVERFLPTVYVRLEVVRTEVVKLSEKLLFFMMAFVLGQPLVGHDTYVVISVRSEDAPEAIQQTPVARGIRTPFWSETYSFAGVSKQQRGNLHLKIFRESVNGDQCVGDIDLKISDLKEGETMQLRTGSGLLAGSPLAIGELRMTITLYDKVRLDVFDITAIGLKAPESANDSLLEALANEQVPNCFLEVLLNGAHKQVSNNTLLDDDGKPIGSRYPEFDCSAGLLKFDVQREIAYLDFYVKSLVNETHSAYTVAHGKLTPSSAQDEESQSYKVVLKDKHGVDSVGMLKVAMRISSGQLIVDECFVEALDETDIGLKFTTTESGLTHVPYYVAGVDSRSFYLWRRLEANPFIASFIFMLDKYALSPADAVLDFVFTKLVSLWNALGRCCATNSEKAREKLEAVTAEDTALGTNLVALNRRARSMAAETAAKNCDLMLKAQQAKLDAIANYKAGVLDVGTASQRRKRTVVPIASFQKQQQELQLSSRRSTRRQKQHDIKSARMRANEGGKIENPLAPDLSAVQDRQNVV